MSYLVVQIEKLRSQHSAVDMLLQEKKKMQGFVSSVQNLAESAGLPIEVTRRGPATVIETLGAMNP